MAQVLRNIEQAERPFNAAEREGLRKTFGRVMTAYKSATQSVVSSTTFVNDNDLWIELPVGAHRVTMIMPLIIGAAASNIKIQLVPLSGLSASSLRMAAYFFLDATAPSVLPIAALTTPVNGGATNAWTSLLITGTVNVTNQGVLQLQWAQNSSGAAATQVLLGAECDTQSLT